MSIQPFLRKLRISFTLSDPAKQIREVHISEIGKEDNQKNKISKYLSDRAPLYYRNIEDIINSLQDGFLLSTVVETLEKLPTSKHFQSSHFGEIVASIFLEDILGLKSLYNKLSHNTTENQNAFKMDVLCYDPNSDPIEFTFCEVKSSPKSADEGLPAGHDKSCYADVFNSLRKYSESDQKFDLTSIKDRLNSMDPKDKERIRVALKPYQHRVIRYIGISVIDHSTYDDDEVEVLAKRKSNKDFNAEIICMESYKEVSVEVYSILEAFKNSAT